jgi:ABC-type Fe3+/spermidine/putrescine transport system ATPase subunit
MLGQVGLGDKLARRPAELSGGEAQRLSLCRALITRPELLLLDEPLHSVDVHLRDELALLVCDLARRLGVTLLVVTHDRGEALAMAEQLVVLRAGKVVESGTALQLLREPRTAYVAAFLWQAACLPTTRGQNGSVSSVFGEIPGTGAGRPDLALVLMPGDVEEADPVPANPRARVLRVEVTPAGPLAAVDLAGHTVRVRCSRVPAAGEELWLRLRGAPRLLPTGDGVAR